MNLRKKKLISHGVEGKAPVRKVVNKARWGYYIFLTFALLYILRIFIMGYLEIKGTGQIILPQYDIKVKADNTISNLSVREGDVVKSGDFLFTGVYEKVLSKSLLVTDGVSFEKTLLSVRLDIAKIKGRIQLLNKKLKDSQLFYSLNLYNNNVNITKDKDDLLLLKSELGIMKQRLKSLKGMKAKEAIRVGGSNLSKRNYTYSASRDGTVVKVFNKNKDFVMKGNRVISVAENAKGYIAGYFEPSKIKYLNAGTELKIILPNEMEIIGLVAGMESAKIGKVEKYAYSYIPDSTSLKVIIVLKDIRHLPLLKKYNEMSVKIRMNRWHF